MVELSSCTPFSVLCDPESRLKRSELAFRSVGLPSANGPPHARGSSAASASATGSFFLAVAHVPSITQPALTKQVQPRFGSRIFSNPSQNYWRMTPRVRASAHRPSPVTGQACVPASGMRAAGSPIRYSNNCVANSKASVWSAAAGGSIELPCDVSSVKLITCDAGESRDRLGRDAGGSLGGTDSAMESVGRFMHRGCVAQSSMSRVSPQAWRGSLNARCRCLHDGSESRIRVGRRPMVRNSRRRRKRERRPHGSRPQRRLASARTVRRRAAIRATHRVAFAIGSPAASESAPTEYVLRRYVR